MLMKIEKMNTATIKINRNDKLTEGCEVQTTVGPITVLFVTVTKPIGTHYSSTPDNIITCSVLRVNYCAHKNFVFER